MYGWGLTCLNRLEITVGAMEKESKVIIDCFLVVIFNTNMILWLISIVKINNFIPIHNTQFHEPK